MRLFVKGANTALVEARFIEVGKPEHAAEPLRARLDNGMLVYFSHDDLCVLQIAASAEPVKLSPAAEAMVYITNATARIKAPLADFRTAGLSNRQTLTQMVEHAQAALAAFDATDDPQWGDA